MQTENYTLPAELAGKVTNLAQSTGTSESALIGVMTLLEASRLEGRRIANNRFLNRYRLDDSDSLDTFSCLMDVGDDANKIMKSVVNQDAENIGECATVDVPLTLQARSFGDLIKLSYHWRIPATAMIEGYLLEGLARDLETHQMEILDGSANVASTKEKSPVAAEL